MQYIVNDNEIRLVDNDKTIAFIILDKNIIKNIFVEKEYRNISYGRNLLIRAINVIKNKGYKEIIVEEFDDSLYNFFKKQGFKIRNNSLVYDELDKELLEEKTILRTSIIAFVLNLFLASAKLIIGYAFGLSSIMADGLNAASDCITNLLVIAGIKISKQPENDNFPLGYGKIESIFSILIGNLIVYSAVLALFDNIKKLLFKQDVLDTENTKIYIPIIFFFIILKIGQFLYVKYVAEKYNNILLKAIIKDYLADILVSTSVLIGTLLSIYYTKTFDIVLAIILIIYIIYQGVLIIYENALTLMDTQDEELLKQVKDIILSDNNIEYVHDLIMFNYANNIYIFADARLNKDLSVETSHEIAEKTSLKVRRKIKKIKRLTLHIEPIY